MTKILIVMQDNCTNTKGGSITISIELANLLSKNGYEVFTCAYNAKTNNRPEGLFNSIEFMNIQESPYANLKEYNDKLNSDLIIFTMPNLYLLGCYNVDLNNPPKILCLHSRPDFYFANDTPIDVFKDCYNNTTAQILFPSYYKLLPDIIKKNNVVCIPNFSNNNQLTPTIFDNKKIVYLSRIDEKKGIDFLLKSFALIANKFPDWRIDLYGQSEPPEYVGKLKKLAKKLKIERQINFKGITKTPIETLKQYSFCCFPSLMEGFPVGLIEAQSIGLPAIGLKVCTGVNELIIDNQNGFLADYNIKDFANKIEILIKDADLRNKMAVKAIELSSKYNKDNFEKSWIELINKVINGENLKWNTNSNNKHDMNYDILPIKKLLENPRNYKKKIYWLFSLRNIRKGLYKEKILTIFGINFVLGRSYIKKIKLGD